MPFSTRFASTRLSSSLSARTVTGSAAAASSSFARTADRGGAPRRARRARSAPSRPSAAGRACGTCRRAGAGPRSLLRRSPGVGELLLEPRDRRPCTTTRVCWTASWIGVSGFLISCASRRATSCHAPMRCRYSICVARLREVVEHRVERAAELGHLVAAAQIDARVERARRRPRARSRPARRRGA